MKTGFLYGDARTPKFVYYYYHGKIMQCRKEPWIPPYIYYDTHPPEYPPNYYYECDTMPDGATPPMINGGGRCMTTTIGGGLFDVRSHYCPGYGSSFVKYYWNINPTAKLEITASFPTLEVIDHRSGTVTCQIYINSGNSLGVGVFIHATKYYDGRYVYEEFTRVYKTRTTFLIRPFTNNIHIIFEKILGTNKWNFYFNDEWMFDVTNPTKDRTTFHMSGPSNEYGHATMDYIRAWKDTERF